MDSEENGMSSSTNSDPTKSIRSSANNNNNSQEDQRTSAQENKILKNDDNSTCMTNKKRTFGNDSILEETNSEPHASSHDFDAPVSKKINTQTYSAANKNVSSPQLSSFSFKPSNRKERKIYKIMHKKNTSDNSKFQHDPLADASYSSQKASIVKSKQNHSSPSKATRGRKKKSAQDTVLLKNTNPPSSSDGLFSDIRIFFIPNNIDRVRLRLLKQKVEEGGGQVVNNKFDASVTHVITALEGRMVLEILGINDIPQVFNEMINSLSPKMRSSSPSSILPKANESKIHSDDPLLEIIKETNIQDSKMSDPEDEIIVSSMQVEENNPNQLIIDKLQVLLNHYQRMRDEWRTLSVGASTAMKWYAKGYRTFDDIIKNVKLTHAQRIGIEYFDDLQERIPRDEVTEISKRVKEAASKIDPDLLCITVGSYIRGQPTCGDIDILITKNGLDGKKDYETSSKYFGLCRLPGGKHRRIDQVAKSVLILSSVAQTFKLDLCTKKSENLICNKLSTSK
ncbi:8816_t:CDS:2 [Racocetra fulgida]|uniref:DNA polymerase n=1 Tax=Racocetra fulgida TaxID=60492 RepID=A0A9N9FQT5_9GLOM|nr:8816_t:CDS:2 [Racocetra fulgida]